MIGIGWLVNVIGCRVTVDLSENQFHCLLKEWISILILNVFPDDFNLLILGPMRHCEGPAHHCE